MHAWIHKNLNKDGVILPFMSDRMALYAANTSQLYKRIDGGSDYPYISLVTDTKDEKIGFNKDHMIIWVKFIIVYTNVNE